MKRIFYVLIFFSFGCSDGDYIIGNCYVSPNPNIICTEEANPVCACNNLVYVNSCEAEKAGNLHHKLTDLDIGDECIY